MNRGNAAALYYWSGTALFSIGIGLMFGAAALMAAVGACVILFVATQS